MSQLEHIIEHTTDLVERGSSVPPEYVAVLLRALGFDVND